MLKKLPLLLTLIIFIGINTEPPTDAATKINNILSKMGVINTISPTGCYTEVSPDALYINTYDVNHELTKNQSISARIREVLNKRDATKAEKEEAMFFCYHFGTKFKNAEKTKNELRIKNIMLKSTSSASWFSTCFLVVSNYQFFPQFIVDSIGRAKFLALCKFSLVFIPGFTIHTLFNNWFNHRCRKQDKEELDQNTFYNLGLYTDTDYPHLFEKMPSPLFKKAFEEGRKQKIN